MPLTDDEGPRVNKIPANESSNSQAKPQECPFGQEWNFVRYRFLRVL